MSKFTWNFCHCSTYIVNLENIKESRIFTFKISNSEMVLTFSKYGFENSDAKALCQDLPTFTSKLPESVCLPASLARAFWRFSSIFCFCSGLSWMTWFSFPMLWGGLSLSYFSFFGSGSTDCNKKSATTHQLYANTIPLYQDKTLCKFLCKFFCLFG